MGAAVNFYYNIAIDTKEIHNKVTDDFLAIKIIIFKSITL